MADYWLDKYGNKRPYAYYTVAGGTLAGRHAVPIINSVVSAKERKQNMIKDQNGNGYAKSSDPTQEASSNAVLTFQALAPKFTAILEAFADWGGTLELLQEDEGRDGVHKDYWFKDPAVSGTTTLQGQDSFTITYEGDVNEATAS